MVETGIFIHFCMHACPLRLGPYLGGEGMYQKSENTWSFQMTPSNYRYVIFMWAKCLHRVKTEQSSNQRLSYKLEGKSLYVRGLLQNYATSSYELICTLTYQSFLWPTLLRPWGGFTRKEEKTPYEFFEEKWFQAVNYYITKL